MHPYSILATELISVLGFPTITPPNISAICFAVKFIVANLKNLIV